MEHFAGLDVSVKETAICVVDELGKVCREVKVTSHPEDLLGCSRILRFDFKRIGLEAGPLSQWLMGLQKQTSRSCASRRDTQGRS
jgi:transposase